MRRVGKSFWKPASRSLSVGGFSTKLPFIKPNHTVLLFTEKKNINKFHFDYLLYRTEKKMPQYYEENYEVDSGEEFSDAGQYQILVPAPYVEENAAKTPFVANGFTPPFVTKLWMMVNDNNGMCYWGPDGTSIVVNQEENKCLAQYFKSSVVTSFIRQFNMYGFSKVHTDPNNGNIVEFKNEFFQQNRPELLEKIKRKEQKSRVRTKKGAKQETSRAIIVKQEAKSAPSPPPSRDLEDRLAKVEGELKELKAYTTKLDDVTDFMTSFLQRGVTIDPTTTHHKYDGEAIRRSKRNRVTYTINIETNEPRSKRARTRVRQTSLGYGSAASSASEYSP